MAFAGICISCCLIDTQIGMNAPLIKEVLWSETSAAASGSITNSVAKGRKEGSILVRITTDAFRFVTWGLTPDDPSVATSRRVPVNQNNNEGQQPYDVYLAPGETLKWSTP